MRIYLCCDSYFYRHYTRSLFRLLSFLRGPTRNSCRNTHFKNYKTIVIRFRHLKIDWKIITQLNIFCDGITDNISLTAGFHMRTKLPSLSFKLNLRGIMLTNFFSQISPLFFNQEENLLINNWTFITFYS